MQADGDSIDLFLRHSFGRLVLSRGKWSSGLLEVWINFFFVWLGKLKVHRDTRIFNNTTL